MKIYFKTRRDLGHSIHRVETELKKRAPDSIQWVEDIEEADFIVAHMVEPSDYLKTQIATNKPYAIFFHCNAHMDRDFSTSLFKNAKLVYSTLPLKEVGYEGNIIRGPIGVDNSLFTCTTPYDKRNVDIVTTGHVAESEGIDAMVDANTICNGSLIHIGGGLNACFGYDVGKIPGVSKLSNISDEQMVNVYNSTKYVSGLRRFEGFEMPVIEGLLCGARPICFDTPIYRYWFNDLAIFVPEVNRDELAQDLVNVFKSEYRPVTEEEMNYVRTTFDWDKIANVFWSEILN